MNVAIGSMFRDSMYHLSRYFKQIDALRTTLGTPVRVIAAEGDSRDETLTQLKSMPDVQVVDATHGGPRWGSTEQPERMAALSYVANKIFASVRTSDDIFVYVESDLRWEAGALASLIDKAVTHQGGFDVFAPLIFAGQHFYDVWGFRKDGTRFGPFPPYHLGINGTLTEIDSAGSCLAMKAVVARWCRIRNDYALVGWCEDARSRGYRIAVCSDLRIHHR